MPTFGEQLSNWIGACGRYAERKDLPVDPHHQNQWDTYQAIMKAIDREDFAGAENMARAVLASNNNDIVGLALLGTVLVLGRRWKEGINAFEKGLNEGDI